MPTGKEIPNLFHVLKDDILCVIEVSMQSKDHDLMKYLMDTIDFAIPQNDCPYTFEASPAEKNSVSLCRKIFVKKKNKI